MKYLAACLAILSFLLAPASATGQPAALQEDLQCLLAMGGMQASDDVNANAIGNRGAPFFLGKVVATQPNIDVAAQLKVESSKLQGRPTEAILRRCLDELTRHGLLQRTPGGGSP